jgi:hypothetical protein
VVPDPNDSVGDLVWMLRDVPYELYLRGNPEKTLAVIVAEAKAAEKEAVEWTTRLIYFSGRIYYKVEINWQKTSLFTHFEWITKYHFVWLSAGSVYGSRISY